MTALRFLIACDDELSALALQQRLELEGVATVLRTDTTLLGVARRCTLYVAPDLLHRAQWLLKTPPVSDAELEYLATGALPEGSREGDEPDPNR